MILIKSPSQPLSTEYRYKLTPRAKTSFNTVMSADDIIDTSGEKTCMVKVEVDVDVKLSFVFPFIRGYINEQLTLEREGENLTCSHMLRSVFDSSDKRVRHEEVLFNSKVIPLPVACYPEVALPFLLAWQPFDGKIRDIYAWINDKFLARVEYQSTGVVKLGSDKVDAVKMIMYPDLNDWVRLGKLITKLVRPFVPKYHIWYSPEWPHKVLRFEGPYGPPGAPEIVMELLD